MQWMVGWFGTWMAALVLLFVSDLIDGMKFADFMIRHNISGFLAGGVWALVAGVPALVYLVTHLE